jgi:hypothetical protein
MRYALIALALLTAAPAAAQSTRFYDERGRFVGRAEDRGNQQRFFDAQGRFTGRVEMRPNGEHRRYDAQGRFIGSGRPSR